MESEQRCENIRRGLQELRDNLEKRFNIKFESSLEKQITSQAWRAREGVEDFIALFYLECDEEFSKESFNKRWEDARQKNLSKIIIPSKEVGKILGRIAKRIARDKVLFIVEDIPSNKPSDKLWELLDGLSPKDAVMLQLAIDGYGVVEIAKKLSSEKEPLSVSTISRKLTDLKQRLKYLLQRDSN